MERAARKDLISSLQQQILNMQGCPAINDSSRQIGTLAGLEQAFPNRIFPLGAIHELVSYCQEDKAATSGFISALVSRLNHKSGFCLWIAEHRSVFPPALQLFGIPADKVIFIDVTSPRQALWVTEEALKCGGFDVVVAEVAELDFTQSRRLQLAVEQSRVTGFVHRYQPRTESTVACVSRWRIRPIYSATADDLPGIGFCRWNVELLKVRNGRPGQWQMEWAEAGMRQVVRNETSILLKEGRKTA